MQPISSPLLALALVLGVTACATSDPMLARGATARPPCPDFAPMPLETGGQAPDGWGGYRSGILTDWDVDNDRRVSRAEFEAFWRASGFSDRCPTNRWRAGFDGLDGNRDGAIDAAELLGGEGARTPAAS